MSKKTTVKPIELGYAAVGNCLLTTPATYTKVMGVLKGFSIAQDTPDETEIEAEFYDSPFDIIYDGKPIKFTFDLVNYDLSELPALFGGAYTAATASVEESYEGAVSAYTTEHEWKLSYQRGNAGVILYKGKTIGTIKQDSGGALAYSVTITSLVHTASDVDYMYKIIGDPKVVTPAP